MSDVKETVIKFVAKQLKKNEEEITGSSQLEELGADSIDMVEFLMLSEDIFKIDLDVELAEDVNTIDEMIVLIKKELDRK